MLAEKQQKKKVNISKRSSEADKEQNQALFTIKQLYAEQNADEIMFQEHFTINGTQKPRKNSQGSPTRSK